MRVVTDTFITILVFATLAQAWSWLGAYAGIASFGHVIFFGIGAYAVAVSNFRGGSPWYGALGGALFAVIAGAVCGAIFLRGRGYVFALMTLVLGALVEPFVAAHSWLGPGDAYSFPRHFGFLNLQFEQKWPYVLLAVMVFGVTQALTLGLRSTRFGYYLRALRSNRIAARSVGIRARPLQLLALVVSAFVTSVAGSFWAQYVGGVAPHAMFAISLAFDIALIGSIAGPGALWGPPLAAAIFVALGKVVPLHPSGVSGDLILVAEAALIALIVFRYPGGLSAAMRRSWPALPVRA